MVLTTMCIMMASAGVSNTASTAAATRTGGGSDNGENGNSANSHHNGYSGRENNGGGGSGSSNNGRNPYHHHHQFREHPHPDISASSSHYNNEGGGGNGGSSSSTNPFAYWTSVTHHYNSYITHPNYHFTSSSSGSPYNYNNGHTYTFGVLLNSENEASTALFLNASTPPTPSDKQKGGESSGSSSSNSTGTVRPSSKYTLFQQILIAWGATCLGLLTVVGNILVMISFKIDKQLQTISNYFLFSLAVADFLIGTVGMPLSTVYLLAGYWPFGKLLSIKLIGIPKLVILIKHTYLIFFSGERVCDAWLAVDYLTSNASVLNLLMISFDRYFSVTRPLTYR